MPAYREQLRSRRDPVAGMLAQVFARVRREPKRVVFAEGEEEAVIRAAASFVHQGLGSAMLVGREDRVRDTAKMAGIELGNGIEIHNARLSKRNAAYAAHLYERLQRKGLPATRLPAHGQPGPQSLRRLHGRARRRRRHGQRRHPQLFRGSRGRAPVHRPQARPPGDGRVAGARAWAHGAGRRHRGDRDAERRGTRGDFHRGRQGGPQTRLRAAAGFARLRDLRPSAGRPGGPGPGGRAHPRPAPGRFSI